MELSNILVSDVIEELSSNAKFNALSSGVKLQKVRTAVQRVMEAYKAKAGLLAEVVYNTLSAGTIAAASFNIRSGTAVVDTLYQGNPGYPVAFSSGLSGSYVLTCWDSGGQAVPTTDQNANGFKAYPVEDGTTIHYIAIPEA
jgi:hypothetical protein